MRDLEAIYRSDCAILHLQRGRHQIRRNREQLVERVRRVILRLNLRKLGVIVAKDVSGDLVVLLSQKVSFMEQIGKVHMCLAFTHVVISIQHHRPFATSHTRAALDA